VSFRSDLTDEGLDALGLQGVRERHRSGIDVVLLAADPTAIVRQLVEHELPLRGLRVEDATLEDALRMMTIRTDR
jgi:hypothetical protein